MKPYLILLLFCSGCHFCHEEMALCLGGLPFLGGYVYTIKNWAHNRKKCKHQKETLT